ncbi:hypothetical protein QBC32DRAFT_317420 [Pseudoneurospora amorphoporcata]|uniref:Uncharacterized protein n=1 Tax=Pseudoneurospora amorphoporcata TaxID=241081 RepID=A0AAN6SDC6_9PEZI|nr:hypothetical protein QBC32DRAFT_317420 [Pseudoneurospora amorphoporcata]
MAGLVFKFNSTDLILISPHWSEDIGQSRLKKRLDYLPIPPGDNIVHIGTLRYYQGGRILVRMRLSGDIILNLGKDGPHDIRKPLSIILREKDSTGAKRTPGAWCSASIIGFAKTTTFLQRYLGGPKGSQQQCDNHLMLLETTI